MQNADIYKPVCQQQWHVRVELSAGKLRTTERKDERFKREKKNLVSFSLLHGAQWIV